MEILEQIFLAAMRAIGAAILGVLLSIAGCRPVLLAQTPFSSMGGRGVLVFGPHPDDAVLGCSGIMMQARAGGQQVHVVLFTNGDGDDEAAAGLAKKPAGKLGVEDYMELSRSRQMQAKRGLAVLGLKPSALILLGYPDAGLDRIYLEAGANPFTSPFTQKSETYALVQRDYHTSAHGAPASYTRQAVLDDVVALIKTLQPSQIYVTSEADGHPDHKAAFWFVRDAIKTAGYQGEFYTYLIHEPGLQWPWPRGSTPESPFEPPHAFGQKQIKFKLPWPPPKRVPLTPEGASKKLRAIRCHRLSFLSPARDMSHELNMESFVKSDEVFWLPVPQ